MSEKACPRCGETKPLAEYPGDRRTKDGKASACKVCRYAAHKAWCKTERGREIKRELTREYEARNRDTLRERGRAKYREKKDEYYRRTYAANTTAKGKARKSVHNAVRAGRMVKPDHCQRCGAHEPPHRIHAHHHDYTKPRDVEWICSVCHGMEHRAA